MLDFKPHSNSAIFDTIILEHMKRNDFLKALGLSSVAAVIPFKGNTERIRLRSMSSDCTLIPTETAGPFPLDLTDNTFYFRQDVREDRIGALLHLRMRIIGSENCEPMANVRVNIWHCDNEGNYSGYGTEVGLTYLRGYQMTDANGEVEFITTFPGWYPGRVCHIHFQVYVNPNYSAVSQLTFDHETTNQVYATSASLYPNGADPLSPATDGVFSSGYALQLSSLEGAEVPETYDSFLEVTVQGTGSPVGLSFIEQQTAAQVILGQNFPNPYIAQTSIPLQLIRSSSVRLEIWDSAGKQVHAMELGILAPGEHNLRLNFEELGLPSASYLYQCIINNDQGRFSTCKRMTLLK